MLNSYLSTDDEYKDFASPLINDENSTVEVQKTIEKILGADNFMRAYAYAGCLIKALMMKRPYSAVPLKVWKIS